MEDKDIDILYVWSEDNPSEIITKNTLEAYFAKHMKTITEGELWEIMDTGRDNFKNTRVTDDVISRNKTEYSSHTLAEAVGEKHKNDRILVTRSMIGK